MLLEKIARGRGFSADFLKPVYGEFESLPGAREAAERIIAASCNGEKVLIYGDYDADGVTASTVMKEALSYLGIDALVMLPDRFRDGYGMSERLVEFAVSSGVGLVVTVDCGSNNAEIIDKLLASGIETVVTDHHEMTSKYPKAAVAVVNPKNPRNLAPESLQNLAGVGVAFMVAYELILKGKIPEGQEKWLLDLVLIGTLCDAILMQGVNRSLCYWGMKVLAKTRRVGLLELMQRAGVKKVTSEAIGFQIGPRINAAGRMKSADLAFDLLNADSRVAAARLADELEELNVLRKNEQGRAVREIAKRGVARDPVLVEVGDWHEGVLGIIAGRLVEDYRKPAFVLTEVDGALKGSGRSFGDFNLAKALCECQNCLEGGGGHAGACGLKVLMVKLDEFRKRVNEYYKSLKLKNQERFLEVSPDLTLDDFENLTVAEIEKLAELEPYGEGNMEPVVNLSGVEIVEAAKLGEEGKHLRLVLKDKDGRTFKAMAFYAPSEWLEVSAGERADVLVYLNINEWQGVKSPEGRIVNLRVVK